MGVGEGEDVAAGVGAGVGPVCANAIAEHAIDVAMHAASRNAYVMFA